MSLQTLEIDERYLGYCLKVELEQTFESPDVLKALRFPRKSPFSSKQPSPLQLPGQESSSDKSIVRRSAQSCEVFVGVGGIRFGTSGLLPSEIGGVKGAAILNKVKNSSTYRS